MSNTPNLELPEFGSVGVPSGADLTTGMRRLDALVQLNVRSFTSAPPAIPVLGDRYIVDWESTATGAFVGRERHIAAYTQAGWVFFVPREGWIAMLSGVLWYYSESAAAWLELTGPGAFGSVAFVGEDVAASAQTNLTVSGLDLDDADTYLVQADILGGSAGSGNLSLFFNGDTTAANYERGIVSDGAAIVTGDNAVFGSIPNLLPGRWDFTITRGPSGRPIAQGMGARINGAEVLINHSAVIWDTAANVTSITINSSTASQLASGSRVRVWRQSTT